MPDKEEEPMFSDRDTASLTILPVAISRTRSTSRTVEYPDVGSVVARELAGQAGEVPLYVGNTKFYGGGPGYLGPGYAPFMPGPNPITSTGNNTYDPVPLHLTAASRGSLVLSPDGALVLRRRHALLRTLDALPRALDRCDGVGAFDSFQRRAVGLLAGRRTREAFDLAGEDARLRARYGETDWGRGLLTARRLVEAGVRFVQCQANLRLRPGTGPDHDLGRPLGQRPHLPGVRGADAGPGSGRLGTA
jgi:hypothetical protein